MNNFNTKQKISKNLIWLVVLSMLFFTFHHLIFLGNYKSTINGNETFPDWFILVSSAPGPLELEKIILDETKKPNYINPFQFKYKYTCDNPKCIAILFEEQKFLFGKLKVKNNSIPFQKILERYPPKGDFMRGFTTTEYPNGLFFLIQYSILLAFAFKAAKFIKS